MAPPHALRESISPPRRTPLGAEPDSEREWQEEIERQIGNNTSIRQAKVVNTAAQDSEPQWAVAVLLHTAETDGISTLGNTKRPFGKLGDIQGYSQLLNPKHWIMLNDLPTTANGAIDDNLLRQSLALTQQNSTKQSEDEAKHLLNEMKSTSRFDTNIMERVLTCLWAAVLKIDTTNIRPHDSFSAVGGDSSTAIGLSALAYTFGLSLPVSAIMKNQNLADMAGIVGWAEKSHKASQPFGLLPQENVESIKKTLHESCQLLDDRIIEDALPCSPLQEGLMDRTMQHPGSHIMNRSFTLPTHIDIPRFKYAWETTVLKFSTLRTRIVKVNGVSLQVVVRDEVGWDAAENLSKRPDLDVRYGSRLCRYALSRLEPAGPVEFIWQAHAAVHDVWGVRLILQSLSETYNGTLNKDAVLEPFSTFIRSIITSNSSEKTATYWRKQLEGAKRAAFPAKREILRADHSGHSGHFRTTVELPHQCGQFNKAASSVRAAWALVLARYCETNDICFGAAVSGRSGPRFASQAGPCVATVPVRVEINRNESVMEFLSRIQNQEHEMADYEQYGLRNLGLLGSEIRDVCDFSSLLLVQPALCLAAHDAHLEKLILDISDFAEDARMSFPSYPLYVQAQISDCSSVELIMTYDTTSVADAQIQALSNQLGHVIQQFYEIDGSKLVADVSITSPWDIQQVNSWNQEQPAFYDDVGQCPHELFIEQARKTPNAEALYSTDMTLTYRQLDQQSNAVAQYLAQRGIAGNAVLPFCIEKSALAIIVMLGISKAGATFVHSDSTHPPARRQALCDLVQAKHIITSPTLAPHVQGMKQEAVVITNDILQDSTLYDGTKLPTGSRLSDMYIIFSSGSTGTPKCIPMQHGAATSTLKAQLAALALPNRVRMLQFTSFNFDVSIIEAFLAFFSGGTICVPSEGERLESTAAFATAARANQAILTPSFARTMTPGDYPTLETLVLFGEKVTADLVETWQPRTTLINSYGLTESGMLNTAKRLTSSGSLSTNVGRGFNCHCWIVEPDNCEKLTPLGCTGELVLHGFAMSRGFLNAPDLTAKAFPSSMSWETPEMKLRNWKYNRTGDLARFLPDGNIEIITRSDTQIKIRGRRVDVTEIETAFKQANRQVEQVAVDLITLPSRHLLVAFIALDETAGSKGDGENLFLKQDDSMQEVFRILQNDLQAILPAYMIPSVFIPLREMLFAGSMKTDRRRLRQLALQMSEEEINGYTLLESEVLEPTTELEVLLRDLWAKVIHVSPQRIGKSTTFLGAGGDSIHAIQLASLARDQGLNLSAAQIFQCPRLQDMAAITSRCEASTADHAKPLELLKGLIDDVDDMVEEARMMCNLDTTAEIEDVLPAISLQEGLMVEEMKYPGTYTSHRINQLPDDIDPKRFRTAWEKTVTVCACLRTRLVRIDGYTLQIVLKGATGWLSDKDMAAWEPSEATTLPSLETGLGKPLCRYGLVQRGGHFYFIWSLHHAIYDGWTLGLVSDLVQGFYEDPNFSPAITPPSTLIQSIHGMDAKKTADFWHNELRDAKAALFPPALPVSDARKRATHAIHTHDFASATSSAITKATILRAAWGLLLTSYADSDDVCFGQVLSGRQIDLAGIEKMPGLALATVPARMRLDKTQLVEEMLLAMQQSTAEGIEFEQYGLSKIAQISPEAKEACSFTSMFAVQPSLHDVSRDEPSKLISLQDEIRNSLPEYLSYSLSLQVEPLSNSFITYFTYDTDVFHVQQIEAMAHQYARIVEQLIAPGSLTVGDLSAVSHWDIEQIKSWNNEWVAVPVEASLHDMLSKALQARPGKTAIVTTAGTMTYKALDGYSTKFAQYLVSIGVKEGMIVPFLFEKSMWAFVAFIGILKAGAAFLPLDISYPAARRQILIEETEAEVMVVSPTQRQGCDSLVNTVIELSPSFFAELSTGYSKVVLPKVSPNSPVYAFFTSGSTGKPKGIILEHAAVSMSVLAHIRAYGLTQETRILQFCSYMFDIIVIDTFGTLIAGGTICAPTEEERLYDCAGFMNFARVNYAVLTPTFARTLDPDSLTTLKTLLMGAEAIPKDVQDMWYGKVEIKYGYGPTEAAVSNTIYTVTSPDTPSTIIGKGFNTDCWIVEPGDHNRLVPVGCVGELVLHGHNLARGYLNNEAATEKAFPKDVDWMTRLEGDTRKFYKTGDLVKFRADGNIEFLSRKDTQVKIRGRRIELGEIETAIKKTVPTATAIAVEVIRLESRDFLAAFMQSSVGKSSTDSDLLLPVDTAMRKSMAALMFELSHIMPSYLVPSVYVPVSKIPLLPSMKTDRKTLQSIGKALTSKQLTEYSFTSTIRVKPTTEMENKLVHLWAKVLKRGADEFGKHDSFLTVGGDSIIAMELVAHARKENMSFTVQDIFRSPKLCDLALLVREMETQKRQINPFSLLPADNRELIIRQAEESLQLSAEEQILDMYPSTPMQESLMAAAEKSPGSYIALQSFKLLKTVNVERFIQAWNLTVDNCVNLRTRLVSSTGKTWQAVLRTQQTYITKVEDVQRTSDSLNALLLPPMLYGSPLCRFKLVKSADSICFLSAMHHSIFDGWSVNILLKTLHNSYQSQSLPPPVPYTGFIDYLNSQDDNSTKEFWIKQLRGVKQKIFPMVKSYTKKSIHNPRLLVRSTQLPPSIDSSVTIPSIVRAAWAIVLSRYFGTNDVCFADTMSGRLAAVDGIEHMSGVTISIVPFRVRVNKDQLVQSFLEDVQAQSSEMIPHEQYGMRKIGKLDPGFKEAIDCGHVLVIQPSQSIESQLQHPGGDAAQILELCVPEDETLLADAERYDSFPLFVNCQILESSLRTSFVYNASYMSEREATALSHHLDTTIGQLLGNNAQTIGDVSVASDWDIDQLTQRNRSSNVTLPEPLTTVLPLDPAPVGFWVSDFHNTSSLAAIGCVGELLLQFDETYLAPSGCEILESNVLSSAIPSGHQLVKTGQFVRYNADGSLDYVGELKSEDELQSQYSGVEDFIVANLPEISGMHFETFTTGSTSALVAFIEPRAQEPQSGTQTLLPVTKELSTLIQSTFHIIQKRWPSQMVPQYVVPINSITSDKATIQTRKLQDIVEQLSTEQFASFVIHQRNIIAPASNAEEELRRIWASALSLQASDISSQDNFFLVGGDSFSAIQLAGQARRKGFNLTTRAVFQNPVLADMAALLDNEDSQDAIFTAPPFSLVGSDSISEFKSSVAKFCGISDGAKIEDIYPCTAMQEGLMSLSVTQPGSYLNKEYIPFAAGVDIAKFKEAWNQVIKLCEILRTRIVLVDSQAFQVVVDENAVWDNEASLKDAEVGYGSRLCYYSLSVQTDGIPVFSFMIHHSIYDGWVLGLVTQTLENVYHQRPAPALQPFSGFVKYVHSMDKAAAGRYWKLKLQGATPASFPAKVSKVMKRPAQRITQTLKKTISFSKDAQMAITTANVVLAAWSLVMARYSSTDDVCFGTTVSGRQAPVSGLEQMAGPMIATVPVRTKIDKTTSIMQFLDTVQRAALDGAAFEQFGLQNIAKLGADAKSACDFTSLLIIQASTTAQDGTGQKDSIFIEKSTEDILDEAASRDFFNYPLVAQVFPSEDSVNIFLTYDAGAISEGELVAFTHQFEHILKQLFSGTDRSLSELSHVSQWDGSHALQSSKLRAASEDCVHWRFEDMVQRYGALPAIDSWDGSFTYNELYENSCRLAEMLQQRGVGPSVLVPVCFAKSSWAIVAMMAVQLAGGTFVSLDAESPAQRLIALISDVNASFVLASKSLKKTLQSSAVEVLVINKDTIADIPRRANFQQPSTRPTDSSFLIFTSGTTGKPKAVDMSHRAICSSADGYGASLNIGPGTRVFQFSAYTFDVAILDILVTLMRGGCVCVPSDYSRIHELAASINSMQANWAFLTPTVANLLSPEDVPCLTTLCLGGEAVGDAVTDKWKDAVHLHGLYGPAESSICAWRPRLGLEGKSTNIGRPLSSAFWVVEPTDHKQLVPVGCIGELLIQGPLLAQGYRNAEDNDQEKWLESCLWLPADSSGRGYLSGDLVRRNADGTYDYMGRKDSQVKLRGQRIETGEIEYHLLNFFPGAKQVVVDIVGLESSESLAAFIDFGTMRPSIEDNKRLFAEARDTLAAHLPSAMRPQYFIPVDDIPQSSTGKLDRRALKAFAATMGASELLQYNATQKVASRQCESPLELELRGYWSQILGIPEVSIGAADNFYSLGGDSIRIVSLVQRIKMAHGDEVGLSVFGSSKTTIEVMAKVIEAHKTGGDSVETPMHDFYSEITSALESLSDIETLQQRCCTSLPRGATVFLTGATGYLGTELLHQLVRQDGVDKIAVLVRANTPEQAMGRVKTTAETAGWWRPEHEAKVEVWLGDLGKQQLGLTGCQYSRLLGLSTSGNVDAIVHNGAVVNWSADFHALKAENVTSTVQLLQVTAASPREPKFVFVSGGTGAKRDGTRSAKDMCEDLSTQNGYSQTKFISESIVCELASKLPRCQNRIAVVKPGLIIGTSSSGVANVDDFLWRLAAASVALGQAPNLGEDQDWVQLAAVDAVAGTIIKPLQAEGAVETFTEMTSGMRMTALWKLIGEAVGLELPLLPYTEWHVAALQQMKEVREKHPLWAVQDFLDFGNPAPQSDEAMMSANAPLAGTADAVRSSVRYLQRIGFIQKSAVDFGALTQPAIGRSGIRSG
ncbi:hypothetical protein LMH87_003225 [Akanthomyces muscarius]|uniref:Carrier domain-containing protein n=3 Tax=Akanthomyces muscarius TaxID=2231603 RepID=A0A9W8Q3Z8_AKAMU|nr:hypothetical protein LMH87_003225 [Akanthomyces muscarius]KAJ4144337.1 hypothetical protein LMH87_003225 [Akanthomyces muscarius]